MVEGACESALYHKQTATKVELYAFSFRHGRAVPPSSRRKAEQGACESAPCHKQTDTKVELYAFSSTANAEPPPGGSLNEELARVFSTTNKRLRR